MPTDPANDPANDPAANPATDPATDPVALGALFAYWCAEHLPDGAALRRGATRAAGVPPGFDAGEFAAADLLSVHFSDGSVWHTAPQSFAERWKNEAAPTRADAPGADRVVLPFELAPPPATRGGGAASAATVEQYRLARLTEPTTLDRIYQVGARLANGLEGWFGGAGAPGAAKLAAKLCLAYESATLDGSVSGTHGRLLRWDRAAAGWRAVGAQAPAAPRVLLLLHGVASSTEGSFAGLWQGSGAEPTAPARDWQQLLDAGRSAGAGWEVLAFEHRSLSASPLRNAVDLIDALDKLPPDCEIHLLSHGRGGLVGELLSLALGAVDGTAPGKPALAERLAQVGQTLRAAYARGDGDPHPDQPALDALLQRLDAVAKRGWRAGTFVRVACPARGSLLADRRTDLFLSLLLRAIGLAAGNGSPWYERFNALARALVAARADARSLPGLEAMVPGAPLSVALNSLEAIRLPGRLRVVAGDARAAGLGGIATLLADVFYGLHDHDFVVHTHAMFGGAPRADARSLWLQDKSVNHWAWFKPGSLSRQPILAVLNGVDAGFNALADDERRTRGVWQMLEPDPRSRWPLQRWVTEIRKTDVNNGRPILVVLPGIMGSELGVKGAKAPVWLSVPQLLAGGLVQLALDEGAAGNAAASGLQPTGLMAVAYERLLDRAAKRFHLVPFAFDWRRSIVALGDDLYAQLRELLPLAQQRRVPIHLLVHSMGGLVARVALFYQQPPDPDAVALPDRSAVPDAERQQLWRDITALGGRMLMLGTPNRGSYAPAQLLLQQHSVANVVGMLGARVSAADLARFGAGYPGLMAMLPDQPDPLYGDLFRSESWATLANADHALVRPDAAVLQRAARIRQWLAASFDALKNNPNVFYVAGHAATPLGFRRIAGAGGGELAGSVLRFGSTHEGDGTVPWNSTLLPERTWYVAASHGDLPDAVDAFDGYFELLTKGRTQALSQQRPTTRGAPADAGLTAPPPALPCLPVDPSAYVLGVSRRPEGVRWLPPIALRVVHGSLDYARFPLIVGHYFNEGLLGALRRVDDKLDGQVTQATRLKLFVGAERTALYLRPPARDGQPPAYPGAVIVGLGSIGDLTPASLSDSVTRGVLRYAFDHLHQDPWVDTDGTLVVNLSTLLVGTHIGSVTARDSLAGVLQGVWRAGQILASGSGIGRPLRIAELEVIEIEESVALEAAYETARLLKRDEWGARFQWAAGTLELRDGGLRGWRPGREEAVWQRLAVRQDELGGLKFELIAERARVESTQVWADIASLKEFIARASDEGATGQSGAEQQEQFGRVLYRLLLPHTLKSRLANFEQTVLVLDDAAAELPWELLAPPTRGAASEQAARPLGVQAGMVRQRLTSDFRALPQHDGDAWDALVIGAPSTAGWKNERGEALTFAELGGAQREAEHVRGLLGADKRPWLLAPIEPGAPFERVRTAVLERPWRILHLAGHGMVDQWIRHLDRMPGDAADAPRRALRKTGMVLSHQQMLTAGDVEQMDRAPEFVFINCCYSGRDSQLADHDLQSQRNYPVLAAGLALQFIRMGSKAVVCAGWQVEDEDGYAFADRLYRELLDGRRFGAAVQEARRAVYRDGRPRSNTWGAYQCYGDPEWRLVDAELRPSGGDAVDGRLQSAAQCMSHHELAGRILQVAAVAGDCAPELLERQLDGLIESLRADSQRRRWLRSSRVRAAIGEAYRELGAHRKAVLWLQRSAKTAYSRLEMRHMEMAVSSLSRLGLPAGHAAARFILDALDTLGNVSDQGLDLPTEDDPEHAVSADSERQCLRGSDLMRVASATADAAERARLLLQAAGWYVKGYAGKVERDDLAERRAYALSGAMTAAGLAVFSDAGCSDAVRALWQHRPTSAPGADAAAPAPTIDWVLATDQLLDEMARADLASTFWHYTNSLDLRIAREVLRQALALPMSASALQGVDALLQCALVRWPAPAEVESLSARLRQILDALPPLAEPNGADDGALAAGARQLKLQVAQSVERLRGYQAARGASTG